MAKLQAVVLAAGQAERFNTGNTKLLEKVCGQEIILYTTQLLEELGIPTTVVIGHQGERIRECMQKKKLNDINFVYQEKLHGRGNALLCSRPEWFANNIIVMNGDTPFVTKEIIESLARKHTKQAAAISLVKSHCCDPSSHSYDHIIRNDNGQVEIVSVNECSANFQESCCIDAGIYIIDKDFLYECTESIALDNSEARFHISDLLREANRRGHVVEVLSAPFDRIRSIDTFQDLWCAQQVKRAELMKHWMKRGVHFFTAQNVHLDLDVTIGAGTFIGCGVQLFGNTHIKANAHIGHFSIIEQSTIEEHVAIRPHSTLSNTHVEQHAVVGPFACLEACTIKAYATICGNVGATRSFIGEHARVENFSYLNDSHIEKKKVITAGTVMPNHKFAPNKADDGKVLCAKRCDEGINKKNKQQSTRSTTIKQREL